MPQEFKNFHKSCADVSALSKLIHAVPRFCAIIFNSSRLRGYTGIAIICLGASACSEPCHKLASRICSCKETEEEQKQCTSDLNLAGQHENFSLAQEPKVCDAALEKCTCKDFNEGKDGECGMYRRSAL